MRYEIDVDGNLSRQSPALTCLDSLRAWHPKANLEKR